MLIIRLHPNYRVMVCVFHFRLNYPNFSDSCLFLYVLLIRKTVQNVS